MLVVGTGVGVGYPPDRTAITDAPPAGYDFLVDELGNYVVDELGNKIIVPQG